MQSMPIDSFQAHADEVVEVTTTFDSTVVDVEHLKAATDRKRWVPFACGVVLAAIAALSFGSAVSLANKNKVAKEQWAAADKNMADFRPERLSLGYEVLAGFGLFGAVLCFGIGAWRRGGARDALMVAPDGTPVSSNRFETVKLVEASDVGVSLASVQSMSLSVWADDEEHTEEEAVQLGLLSPVGAGKYRLRPGAKATYDAGLTRFFVATTAAPRASAAAALWRLEGRSAQFLAGSAIVHLLVLALLWSIPPDARALSAVPGLDGNRFVRLTVQAQEPELKEHLQGSQDAGDSSAGDELMSPPDGTTGKPDVIATSGRYTITKRANEPQLSHAQVMERARSGGILGVFSASDPFANIEHGTADFSSGFGREDVRGGLNGAVGEVGGSFGSQWGVYGGTGTGPGYGTISSGSYGLHGTCGIHSNCGPGGNGIGVGNGPGLRKRTKRKPTVTIGRVTPTKDADPSIIRRYIRRKLPQIRHCYESRLILSPDLSGTVTTQFVISPKGAVMGARASGSGDSGLESCVANVMATIDFPKFDHLVNVTYPFTFHPAG